MDGRDDTHALEEVLLGLEDPVALALLVSVTPWEDDGG